MSDLPAHTDIMIVGAGPTGLALAAGLHRLGFTPLLVDRQAEGANTSRAAVIHARTLEVLEPLGVVPDLLAEGLKITDARIRDRDRVIVAVDFSHLKTAYPFTLMCPQNRTEAILLSRLETLGGTVHRPVEVKSIDVGADAVSVSLADGSTVRANWLIGCDGGHSRVREAAGIAFEGGAYEETFALADVHMDWPFGASEMSLYLAPSGLLLVVPLPGEHYRIIATVADSPPEPDAAFFKPLLDARGPATGSAHIRDIVWSSRFRIQHRVASTPRKGRVLLCGDAAHVHSPAGGQGMNTGIQDAVTLSDALQAAIRDHSDVTLDAWAARRHEIATNVVDLTDRLTRIATLKSAPARTLRNMGMAMAGYLPGFTDRIAHQLSELDNR